MTQLRNVVEVADLAWDAYELWDATKDHPQTKTDYLEHKLCLQLESDLARERSQNVQIRAVLQEVKHILSQNTGVSPDSSNSPCSCPSDLSKKLLNILESLNSSEGLESLQNVQKNSSETIDITDDTTKNSGVDKSDSLCYAPKDKYFPKEELCNLENDSFVIVNEEDIVEGMAMYIGQIIGSNPQSKAMSPEQLQTAISRVFSKMERSSTVKHLWTLTKVLYTLVSWGITIYGIYTTRNILKTAAMMAIRSGKAVHRVLT